MDTGMAHYLLELALWTFAAYTLGYVIGYVLRTMSEAGKSAKVATSAPQRKARRAKPK